MEGTDEQMNKEFRTGEVTISHHDYMPLLNS